MKRLIQLILFCFIACAADAQRIKLLQLERYLGDTVPLRKGYVGLTDALGDQYYKKLDSIIVSIADSLIGLIPPYVDLDQQYFDTSALINDTLVQSIYNDGRPASRISFKGLIDHDIYEVGTTVPPNNINDLKYTLGKLTVGENASYPEWFAVMGSDMRVRDVLIGYGGSGATDPSNLRIGNNALYSQGNGWGYENTAIGTEALYSNDFGIGNFAAGAYALRNNTTGQLQVAIGAYSLQNQIDGVSNVAIGAYSLNAATNTSNNIAIGAYSQSGCITCTGNVAIGYGAMILNTTGYYSVAIGMSALASSNSNSNVGIGAEAGFNNLGDSSVFIGYRAGFNELNSKLLYIENSPSSTPLIWGDFAGDTVRINGSLQVTNRTGTGTTLAGWRGSDNKAVNIGLGPGISIVSGVLYVADTVPVAMDTIIYLDTLIQWLDTFAIVAHKLRASLKYDNLPFSEVDLNPYRVQTVTHFGATDYTYVLDAIMGEGGGTFTLESFGAGIAIAHNGSGLVTIENTGLVTLGFNAVDDAYSTTTLESGNTMHFDGTGGITATLAGPGSTTLLIDGSGIDTDNQNLSLSTISAIQYGLNIADGTGTTFTKGAGILMERTVNDLKISAVDTSVTNEIDTWDLGANGSYTTITNAEQVNFVGTGSATTSRAGNVITINVPSLAAGDHDWYEVGTTTPPDAITDDMFHTGKVGIGMNPSWILDVISDSRIAGHHIGTGAFSSSNTNLRFGESSLSSNVSGYNNIAIGKQALALNQSSSDNIVIGHYAAYFNVSSQGLSIVIGNNALQAGTTTYDNTVIGHNAMIEALTSSYNTVVGHLSLSTNRRGNENTAIGDYVIINDTNSIQNTAMGRYSMENTRKTKGNVSVGYSAMREIKDSANYNTAFGYEALHGSITSTMHEYNTAIGYRAMRSVANSSDKNIFIGYRAGETINGNNNIGIGDSVLFSTSGNNNVVLGNKNTTGSVNDNVIIGYNQHMTTAGNVVLTNGVGIAGLRMLSTGFWGVNEATPTQRWHVNGNLRVTGAYYDSNNEPGTSGQVLSSTVTGTDWITAAGMASFNINGIDDAFVPTTMTNGGTIAFQGTNGITAKLAVLGSGTIVIDGAGIVGSTDLGFNPGGNPTLTSDTGSDVIFQDGSGVDFVYLNGFTITANAVDPLANNEGSLTMLTGPVRINSNTSGSTPITVVGAGTVSVSSTGSSNFTITGTGGSGTVTSVGLTGNAGITVGSSPITTSGTLTLTLNGDLNSLENMSTNGFAVRTSGPSWITRSIAAGPGIGVTAGDGVSANPTITAAIGGLLAGNNISVSGSFGANWTIAQPAFTSLATGFSNGMIIHVDGSGTPEGALFTNLPTGFASLGVVYIDASGTPQTATGSFNYDNTTSTLGVGKITTGNIQAAIVDVSVPTLFQGVPTYADDAAAGAGGMAAGRLYKTSAGDLRIKL